MCAVCCKNVLKTNRLFWDPTPVFLRLTDFSSKVITGDLGLRVQTEYFRSEHLIVVYSCGGVLLCCR